MSNFAFLPSRWSALAEAARAAEAQVYAAPQYCAMLCRKSLEEWVRWLYEHDADLELPPYDTSLSALLHQQDFKNTVAPIQFDRLNLIRKLGNNAVHTRARISEAQALHGVKLLHGFIGWVCQVYSADPVQVPAFDVALVPQSPAQEKTKAELQQLEAAYLAQQEKLHKALAELEQLKANKNTHAHVPPPSDPNEALTRQLYIDTLLIEAGWDPTAPRVAEYPVKNCMPQAEGNNGDGRVDYVLWGDDGLPLAVVEAKRTQRDPRVGQQQARCYADCLEREFGQRPIIFFSNGFKTWLWDDALYAPRAVHGFYSKDELALLIQRRQSRLPLAQQAINNAITDRYYQHEAIRSVTEAFSAGHRHALLVMATGTGKTRVSAALIDLLSKANWVKRVLFLADRNALIHQAKVNFNDYLPQLPAIDLTREKEDESSRVVFSTYQTMINLIDKAADGEQRFYSVGHFDLIIFDEIHRSVYKRYRAIFDYFDGLRVGLTATPRSETDRDTYALFNLEANNPTYAYELEQAVQDQYLVPPVAIGVPLKFQREGVKYAELSPAEKRNYEEQFADPITGDFPAEINAAALNDWLFNEDTVDKVIGYLMQNGIKVEGGDKLAKTIIFARSSKHAHFIKERFDRQYPAYRGHFMEVIDYSQEYRYDSLNRFKAADKLPQIAASVDMLDTGIDVPEVCNLVFFKPVRSSAKFWQMIGRGTRLCVDLFGPGEHKREFVIFDFCENFEFFGTHPRGFAGSTGKTLSQRLFELRLRLSFVLLQSEEEDLFAYGRQLRDFLIQQTQGLNTQSFVVRQHWEQVEKYRDPNRWNALSELDLLELRDHIAPLMSETEQDEKAKRFDALMLDLQWSVLQEEQPRADLIEKVIATAGKLSKKAAIPFVNAKMDLLQRIQNRNYWDNITVSTIEHLRLELRDLLKFLDKDSNPVYFTSFEDELRADGVQEHTLLYNVNNLETYKRRVEQYLHEQRHHLTIRKLHNNEAITEPELQALEQMLFEQGSLGTRDEFSRAYGSQPLGRFIRSIIGLDSNAAKTAFASLLREQSFNAQQIRFLDTLINFLTVKGVVDAGMLFEAPFTDLNSSGIMGVFDEATSARIIDLLEAVNRNAEVA